MGREVAVLRDGPARPDGGARPPSTARRPTSTSPRFVGEAVVSPGTAGSASSAARSDNWRRRAGPRGPRPGDDPSRADRPARATAGADGGMGAGDRPRLLRPRHRRAAGARGDPADGRQGQDVRARDPGGRRASRARRTRPGRRLSSAEHERRMRSPSRRRADGREARVPERRRRARCLLVLACRARGGRLRRRRARSQLDPPLQRPAPAAHHALVAAFEKQTGIKVQCAHERRHRARRSAPPGEGSDLSGRRLPHRELARARDARTARAARQARPRRRSTQVPARYESPRGDWVGIALRVSALAYDPALVPRAELPTSILDLAQPPWKGKVAIAPTDSDFPPLVGAIIATYGKSAASSWLAGLKRNAQLYQADEAVVAAVNRGDVAPGSSTSTTGTGYGWRSARGHAQRALLLPQPRRGLGREHLRRGRARLEPRIRTRRRRSSGSS